MVTKKRPQPKTSKTVAAIGVGAGMLEGKANKWALYGLALALLGCLTAWGSREVNHTKHQRHLETSLAEETKAKKEASSSYVAATEQLFAVKNELQQLKSSKARHQGGKTIRRPNGEIEESWFDEQSETLETLSQTLQELSQTKARVVELEELVEVKDQKVVALQTELEKFNYKVVKRGGGFGFLWGYDLARVGAPDQDDLGGRLKVGGSLWQGPWTIGAKLRPTGPMQWKGEKGGPIPWDRLDPTIEGELRF